MIEHEKWRNGPTERRQCFQIIRLLNEGKRGLTAKSNDQGKGFSRQP